VLPAVKDPVTCPFDVTPQFNAVQVPGETATVQLTAAEEKPTPVNENCDPTVPDDGVTVTDGTIVSVVESTSFPGVPTTLIVHGLLFAVAVVLTTKLPVAMPAELIVHVGDDRIVVLGSACKLHPVSGVRRPVAVNVTVVPGVTELLG